MAAPDRVDPYADRFRLDLGRGIGIGRLGLHGTRRAAARDSGGVPTSSLDLELEGSTYCRVCTRVKLVTQGIDLGHQDGCKGDEGGTWLSEADGNDGANSGKRVWVKEGTRTQTSGIGEGTRTRTSGIGGFLTFLRCSGASSRRREGAGDADRTRRRHG
jgi:hypothetical protein